jgi:hypothetical protein
MRRPEGPAPGPAAPAAGPARHPALAVDIDQLEAEIRRLRIEFERFFSGALHVPPDELRNRVQAQLRTLRNVNAGTAVDRFRLGTLEARFNSYNELYSRRLREREEGRLRAAPAAPARAAPPLYDPAVGVAIGPRPEPAAVAALFAGVAGVAGVAAGGGEGAPRFDLAGFEAYLQRQAAAIRDKTGCDEVQFRLATEDGKLKLKARPVGGAKRPTSE